MLLTPDQIRCPYVGGLNALDDCITSELRTDGLANDGPSAIASHNKAAFQLPRCSRVEIAKPGSRTLVCHGHVLSGGPVEDLDARLIFGVCEEDRLKKDLVDAVGWLRCRPVAVRSICVGKPIAPAGYAYPCQLLAREGRAIADVVRVVLGQAGVAHLSSQTETPEDLHGSRGDMVALGLRWRGARARFHHGDVDASPSQIDRESEPDWSRAHNQDNGFAASRHIFALLVGCLTPIRARCQRS